MLPIRLALTHEAQAVIELVDSAYNKWVSVIGRKPAPMLADYAKLIERGVVYVIEEHAKIVGVLVIWPVDDAMLIENVATHPDYQGQGIGQRLLDFAEVKAREAGLNEMRLYTNEKFTANQDYYRKCGYVQTRLEITDDGRRIVWMHKAAI
jgi:ribosomal protein S18 acetylase RimI-like enzyme